MTPSNVSSSVESVDSASSMCLTTFKRYEICRFDVSWTRERCACRPLSDFIFASDAVANRASLVLRGTASPILYTNDKQMSPCDLKSLPEF